MDSGTCELGNDVDFGTYGLGDADLETMWTLGRVGLGGVDLGSSDLGDVWTWWCPERARACQQ